jgi:hypothetical protein
MLRSRDLLIFAVVFFLLVLGIGLTLIFGAQSPLFTTVASLTTDQTASSTFSASSDARLIDREGTIARLRKLLSQADIVNMPSPSVEDIQDVIATATTSTTSTDVTNVVLQKCPGPDDTLAASVAWPLQDTAIVVQNGTRLVVHTAVMQDAVSAVGTTTASSTQTPPTTVRSVVTSLLRMPEYPPVLDTPSCVRGEVVGVTQSGFLIANKDAVSYKGRGPDDLLGYARDGFPIYGVYSGVVDSCGGYTKDGAYRYSIAKDRNFILGCFSGLPLPFENKPL